MIPFNKPYFSGRELKYLEEVCHSTTMSGNGDFTKKCHTFFEQKYGFKKCLLATSGTDALEMCAMLCNLKPGDEVIVPSYTFVSTALAFLREGAKVKEYLRLTECNIKLQEVMDKEAGKIPMSQASKLILNQLKKQYIEKREELRKIQAKYSWASDKKNPVQQSIADALMYIGFMKLV